MNPSPNSEPYLFPLPQYGFGSSVDFKTLLPDNPFLYRVYTPKERSPFFDETDPYFVAPQFDELYARTPVEVTSAPITDPLEATYADVMTHMEWTSRSRSIFLSTSFSFAWSIWEAVRRYHHGMKKDVEIAVIDASALLGRAATAVEMLRKSSPEERTQQYWKWHRFSSESQSVLVHGFIPGHAVLASVPLLAILERLPHYFLRSKIQSSPARPLDRLAWNYADKKHTYRQFCQEITNRFFAQSQEIRFRDATGGSMRLALTLLRPWFHKTVTQDFKAAVIGLRALAIIVAQWGGQWWAKEHSELNRILDSTANTLGEELLQRFRREEQDQEEIHRLQDTVDTLEQVIRRQETKRLNRPSSRAVKGACCSAPITPESSPRVRPRRTLSMSISMPPRDLADVKTPITPPESPNFSQIFSRNVDLEYLPSTIAFQPFTPPVEWPTMPALSRSGSLSLSTESSLTSRPSTPPPMKTVLSPVIEVPTPADDFAPEPLPEVPEVPRTPPASSFRKPYLPSPASTPPAVLDSLKRDGFRARTISDLSSSLRIEIPVPQVGRQLVFLPSPTGTIRSHMESGESSPGTLAPLSPPIVLAKPKPSREPSLGSPIELVSELEALPPLPASPTSTWSSNSTLPSRAGSPKPKSATREASYNSQVSGSLTLTNDSVVLDQKGVTPTALEKPLPSSRVSTAPSTPLSEYLVTPAEEKPRRGEIKYRVPHPPMSILSPSVSVGEYPETETRGKRTGSTVAESGAFIVTGFLVGAFVTLFMITTQRRTLLSLT
ncbi:hypothetical protein MD484_g697, partial [Candolleomyces efflorescens]